MAFHVHYKLGSQSRRRRNRKKVRAGIEALQVSPNLSKSSHHSEKRMVVMCSFDASQGQCNIRMVWDWAGGDTPAGVFMTVG